MRQPVEMFLEEDGRFFSLIACPRGGVEFTVVKIDKRLLSGEFKLTALVVDDADDKLPKPEPELAS